eukprot:Skav218488  [mRNA]  locus=scaffold538:1290679:1291620:- [translate_table: standard]
MAARRATSRAREKHILAALWLFALAICPQLNFVGRASLHPLWRTSDWSNGMLASVQMQAEREVEATPCRSSDLAIGKYYKATVARFVPNGVKLKMGVDKPVFLHVSRIKPKGEFVKDPADVLKLEEEITVCVKRVKRNEVEVVMAGLENDLRDSHQPPSDLTYYKATVAEFVPHGVKLRMGLDKPVFLHVSHIKPKGEFVKDPADVLKLKEEITVCVKKVKGNEVEVVMAGLERDLGELQKRPLSDFKAGDSMEGTVVTVRPRAAFVDVGAVVDGYFPEENWKAQHPEGLEVGQKVKVQIEEVTGCKIQLAEA